MSMIKKKADLSRLFPILLSYIQLSYLPMNIWV